MAAKYINTLRYWFDVEAVMYPDIPKPGKRKQYQLRFTDPLPWANEPVTPPEAERRPPDTHKYFCYFGLVDKGVLEIELKALYQVETEARTYSGNHVRNARGSTFLCAMEFSQHGVPVASTLQLAAFALAFAEKKSGRRIPYSEAVASLKAKLHNLRSAAASGAADGAWFNEVIAFLSAELDWQPSELMAKQQICLHRVPLIGVDGKPFKRIPEMSPVNSFYLDDLGRILEAAEGGADSAQVQAYLGGHELARDRQDVSVLAVADRLLAPGKFPAARWPSEFPLFLMQQVAVNTAMDALADGGVFSVNGPPGTGKTTLLMDVIAARIAQRADVLLTFKHPSDAFRTHAESIHYPPNSKGESLVGRVFQMDPRLLDAGIVVASANNKAVENITLDLPSLEKVHPQPLAWGGSGFDYFSAQAESILNEEPSAGEEGEPDEAADERGRLRCWGLISVPLGRKANRDLVADRLGNSAKVGREGFLTALAALPPDQLDWKQACERYKSSVAIVREMQANIARHDAALLDCAAAKRRRDAAVATRDLAARRLVAQLDLLDAADASLAELDRAIAANQDGRRALAMEGPWWRQLWDRVFHPAAFARFAQYRAELTFDYLDLIGRQREEHRRRPGIMAEANKAEQVLLAQEAAASAASADFTRLSAVLEELRAALGSAAFDPEAFEDLPVAQQQMALPRSNAACHAARADVFLAAMHLHKAFMKHAGKAFETNFRLALSMLGQQAFLQPRLPLIARDLWASFFLAVPVVSSTFASVSRCFDSLGEGEIGLLLIDEAGQAVPSHALGAVWRARRVLMVGDPLQVEPVITMDKHLDLGILKHHKAYAEHQLTQNSAQHLADRGNVHGANLVQYDGSDLWVGSPLRVHRRCVDPMFSLSNAIAYNGKMVLGLDPALEARVTNGRPLFGASRWIDVVSGQFDEHYSDREGQEALRILGEYSRAKWCGGNHRLPELFIITPFKSVADNLTALLQEHAGQWAADADDDAVGLWLKSHVGTVHTFQGKECESVLFVLGGASQGARNWAGGRPNIINVAATRAKRRLYVIGNRDHWRATKFGASLVDALS